MTLCSMKEIFVPFPRKKRLLIILNYPPGQPYCHSTYLQYRYSDICHRNQTVRLSVGLVRPDIWTSPCIVRPNHGLVQLMVQKLGADYWEPCCRQESANFETVEAVSQKWPIIRISTSPGLCLLWWGKTRLSHVQVFVIASMFASTYLLHVYYSPFCNYSKPPVNETSASWSPNPPLPLFLDSWIALRALWRL